MAREWQEGPSRTGPSARLSREACSGGRAEKKSYRIRKGELVIASRGKGEGLPAGETLRRTLRMKKVRRKRGGWKNARRRRDADKMLLAVGKSQF